MLNLYPIDDEWKKSWLLDKEKNCVKKAKNCILIESEWNIINKSSFRNYTKLLI